MTVLRNAARHVTTLTITIASAANVSDAFDMSRFAGGLLILPDEFEGIVHFEVSDAEGGTYVPLEDSDGSPVTISTTNPLTEAEAYTLPTDTFAAGWIRLATYTDATRTTADDQAAERTITVLLKS